MLEKAADDADDSDTIADARYSWSKAADTAHDEVDVDSSLRGVVEVLDDVCIDQRIHFGDNARALPRFGQLRFSVHHLGESRAHVARRYQQVPEQILPREAGQRIEEISDIGADRGIGGEQTKIGINASRLRVVVARANVRVAPNAVGL